MNRPEVRYNNLRKQASKGRQKWYARGDGETWRRITDAFGCCRPFEACLSNNSIRVLAVPCYQKRKRPERKTPTT